MADVDLKVRIDPNIEGEDALNALVTKLQGYADKPYTIKVKVEAVDGQKGLNNLINGLDNAGKNISKQLASGTKSVSNNMKDISSGAKQASDSIKKTSKNTDVLSASSKRIKKKSTINAQI